MLKRKAEYRAKLPDIEKTLNVLNHLISKKGTGETLDATFSLADNVYAKASVEPKDTVCLWLGANVMVEYSYAEAHTLLSTNYKNAQEKLGTVVEDLDFLRDQIIITEVGIARVFNHNVRERRNAKRLADAAGASA